MFWRRLLEAIPVGTSCSRDNSWIYLLHWLNRYIQWNEISFHRDMHRILKSYLVLFDECILIWYKLFHLFLSLADTNSEFVRYEFTSFYCKSNDNVVERSCSRSLEAQFTITVGHILTHVLFTACKIIFYHWFTWYSSISSRPEWGAVSVLSCKILIAKNLVYGHKKIMYT